MLLLCFLTSASTTYKSWKISTSWRITPGRISPTRCTNVPASLKTLDCPTATQQSTLWSTWIPQEIREPRLIPTETRALKFTLVHIYVVTGITLTPETTLKTPSLAPDTPPCTLVVPSSGEASFRKILRCPQRRRSISLYTNHCRMPLRWCNWW